VWASAVAGLLVAAGHAVAAEPSSPAERAVLAAHRLGLAEQTTWLRLGHYRKGWFGGYTSEVDGRSFFMAAEGKNAPAAELDATLRGFFSTDPGTVAREHALCRFPARRRWLEQELLREGIRLPERKCPRFEEFVGRLDPESLTLVFSSYYLNNPASAFGHTFLRVNRVASPQARSELLDYGIDYAAVVDTTNALLYAFKGLTGMFPGTFNKVPLYYKIREYNDYESRDLWEYDLALTPEQVKLVTAHLWELGSTYFEYYYLSENCSYQIIAALEVADPKIHLLDHTGWPVIPADTVKALFENPGLVQSVHYRPSNRTELRQRLDSLTADERDMLAKLLDDPRAPFTPALAKPQQLEVVDAAVDLVGVRLARDLTKERGDMHADQLALEQALLERRAAYGVPSEEAHFAPPFRQMPHLGHGSSRLGLGSGYDQHSKWFHTASMRLALHDLVDQARGFPDGAAIEFMPLTLRYYVESPRVTLEDASLIRVRSFTPVNRFEHPLSWLIDVGGRRGHDRGCNDCFAGFGEVGGGFAVEPFGSPLMLFALAKAEVDIPVRAGLASAIRLGAGPFGGLRLRVSDDVAALFTGSWQYLPGQRPYQIWGLDAKLRAAYLKNFAFGVEGAWYATTKSVQGVSYLYF